VFEAREEMEEGEKLPAGALKHAWLNAVPAHPHEPPDLPALRARPAEPLPTLASVGGAAAAALTSRTGSLAGDARVSPCPPTADVLLTTFSLAPASPFEFALPAPCSTRTLLTGENPPPPVPCELLGLSMHLDRPIFRKLPALSRGLSRASRSHRPLPSALPALPSAPAEEAGTMRPVGLPH
jgi:hypothetical protein